MLGVQLSGLVCMVETVDHQLRLVLLLQRLLKLNGLQLLLLLVQHVHLQVGVGELRVGHLIAIHCGAGNLWEYGVLVHYLVLCARQLLVWLRLP